jgi:GNAT superfamily N-acetyltransferase
MSFRVEINPPIDSDALNQLFARAWPEHEVTDFRSLLSHALIHACAYQEEQLIGFVKIISDGGIHGFLLDATIDPAHRRKGHGAALVKAAVAEARPRGIEWLHVDYEPHHAGFYARCGFRPTSAGVIRLGK